MKHLGRITRLKKQMSSPQIALLDIDDARRHGSMRSFASALLAGSTRTTRAEAVEAAVRAAHPRTSGEQVQEHIRAAQKEVMFYFRLAVETWSAVLGGERAWRAIGGMLDAMHAMIHSLTLRDDGNIDELTDSIKAWQRFSVLHRKELHLELETTRLIEREYFSGKSIMFPGDERMLEEMLASAAHHVEISSRAREILEGATGDGHDPIGAVHGDCTQDIQELAAAMANRRADLARAYVLYRMGETDRATQTLKGMIAGL